MDNETMQMLSEMVQIFEKANERFLKSACKSILDGLSERSLCGQLMLHLHGELAQTRYNQYCVDVEYNRNGAKLKTIIDDTETPVDITCDLIVHSRGEIVEQDNLMAIEMKKSTHSKSEKDKDKIRLKCLTKDSFADLWSFDGTTLPEHVCRYILGVYYEINISLRRIDIKYYVKGNILQEYSMPF